MVKSWKTLRCALLALAFIGSMGAMKVGASEPPTALPPSESGSCNQFACRQECGPLGGDLVPGGPGQPLRCACCG
ncbi:MAG TPA: hypothetical protein VKB80_23015 [Kofleriaceae bacterium]|nr:hypothetical protein [Kofleriaceae bacterium]